MKLLPLILPPLPLRWHNAIYLAECLSLPLKPRHSRLRVNDDGVVIELAINTHQGKNLIPPTMSSPT